MEDDEYRNLDTVACRLSSVSSAPRTSWHEFPGKSLVSVEHPFIIKNIEKGITSLGGLKKIEELTRDSDGSNASLYLHPESRMSKPLRSANVATNNVLLKITVPKMTGLKRRKGSKGPFQNISNSGSKRPNHGLATRDTQSLIRTLRENPKKCTVEAIGSIDHTHRFRGMPDFVVSTVNMPFMKKMQEQILPFEYEKMKEFNFDMSKGVKSETEIIPPPKMTHITHPFNYTYRQNPSVKQVVDKSGNITTTNIHGVRKMFAQSIPFDAPGVPSTPSADLAPVETLESSLQQLIASARRLLEERPIFTRRALMNALPKAERDTISSNSAKYIYQYCGYSFTSGPWRDATIRFGVDPRTDPEYRIYQTMMFMLDNEPKDSRKKYNRPNVGIREDEQILRRKSHLFDGKVASKDGKIWQVCDVVDPFLKSILDTNDLRKECHIESDGWYHNGTWAKAKVIMKAKLHAILTGLPQDTTAYDNVVQGMPEIIDPRERANARMGEGATRYETLLATQIRSSCFNLGISVAEKESFPEGDNEDNDEEENNNRVTGFAMSAETDDEMIDPELKTAALNMNGSEQEIMEMEEAGDGMDVDNTFDDGVAMDE